MDIDQHLLNKRAKRSAVFQDAASASLLMHGVTFLCRHFYHLLDLYCRVYMKACFRRRDADSAEDRARKLQKLDADATDTYHVLWVIITFLCYWYGWHLYQGKGKSTVEYWLWLIPLVPCIYRIFEILAALIEIYFWPSDAKHHQFRILLHAALHYLSTGFAFALFFACADWHFESFTSEDGGKKGSDFAAMIDPIYYSLLTVVTLGVNAEPQDWLGKLLILLEAAIGFTLATFIFLNITQVWRGGRDKTP